jgi:anti-sigma B factor antagonist
MEVSTTQLKRCDVVTASGRIDSRTAPELAEAFRQITDEGRFRIVFDMTGVDFISSAGLRIMIDVQKTCKRWNRGEMVLVGVQPQVHSAMDLVGFVPLFKFSDNTTEAVGSF